MGQSGCYRYSIKRAIPWIVKSRAAAAESSDRVLFCAGRLFMSIISVSVSASVYAVADRPVYDADSTRVPRASGTALQLQRQRQRQLQLQLQLRVWQGPDAVSPDSRQEEGSSRPATRMAGWPERAWRHAGVACSSQGRAGPDCLPYRPMGLLLTRTPDGVQPIFKRVRPTGGYEGGASQRR